MVAGLLKEDVRHARQKLLLALVGLFLYLQSPVGLRLKHLLTSATGWPRFR
jgi:hypothetical protein